MKIFLSFACDSTYSKFLCEFTIRSVNFPINESYQMKDFIPKDV